jgi:imidazoleglycerol-phosphate dehydratase
MITSLATHSLIDITASVKGDLVHHMVEDLAIGLGEALNKALGTREGITRFGNAAAPMDCSLAFAAVDLVKRPYFKIDLKLRGKKVEEMPTEDINHFFESFATSLQANVHVFVEYGSNDHHKAEAATKALALSLRQAIALDPRRKGVPSSKGVI